MQRLCPRCRHAVVFEEESSLVFCGHCGAPQVRLSEELLTQAEAHREAVTSDEPGTSHVRGVENGSVDWRGAVNCAALAGGIAFLLSLLSIRVQVVGVLTVFWMIGAPVVTLGIYSGRFRQTKIVPGFGARLGLLCGLAVMLAMFVVNIGSVLLVRYLSHGAVTSDAVLEGMFAQMLATAARQGEPVRGQMQWLLDSADFRAGLLLSSLGMFATMYLAFSAAGGAFAGLLRARKPKVARGGR